MITREEVVQRLEGVERALGELKRALREGWQETPVGKDPTQEFLKKCTGWEDSRSPKETISEIYSTRTVSERAETLFEKPS